MDYKNKKITVFGLGISGIASLKKMISLGARVKATETKLESAFNPAIVDELKLLGIELEFGGHSDRSIEGADLIIVSPGIHLDIPTLVKARQNNQSIVSEIELASQFISKPIIAVTGTNGKTTTTTLIAEMLKAGGKRMELAGNIGRPLIDVDDSALDYLVVEVSSYQLEAIDKFKPWISVILNIQPDHLERHHDMEGYIKQKARIFKNQTGDDYLIFNEDDLRVSKMIKDAKARLIGFSKSKAGIITLPPAEINIPGLHNLENSLAAAQAAYLCGIAENTVAKVLRTFPGVEHRIEYTITVNGIEFYNDSKGTNPDSTLVAIDTFPGKEIILILGGRDKGVRLDSLTRKIKKAVKSVILIGEAAERFGQALEKVGFNSVFNAGYSMKTAVNKAFSLASAGEVVLLSPACASFDMFANYEERGRVFKELCRNLKN